MLSNTGGTCAFPDGTRAFQLKTSSPTPVAFTPKPMGYSSRAELRSRGGAEVVTKTSLLFPARRGDLAHKHSLSGGRPDKQRRKYMWE